jgi:hypothetical protein
MTHRIELLIAYLAVALPATIFYLVQAIRWGPYWRALREQGRYSEIPTTWGFKEDEMAQYRPFLALLWPSAIVVLAMEIGWQIFVREVRARLPVPPVPPRALTR